MVSVRYRYDCAPFFNRSEYVFDGGSERVVLHFYGWLPTFVELHGFVFLGGIVVTVSAIVERLFPHHGFEPAYFVIRFATDSGYVDERGKPKEVFVPGFRIYGLAYFHQFHGSDGYRKNVPIILLRYWNTRELPNRLQHRKRYRGRQRGEENGEEDFVEEWHIDLT